MTVVEWLYYLSAGSKSRVDWKLKIVGGVAIVIASFTTTLRVANYMSATCPRGGTTELANPFQHATGFAFVANNLTFDQSADSSEAPGQSKFLVCEGNRLLNPGHSLHAEIGNLGGGRFSHWRSIGFIFSACDNSDPNKNGRKYWAVRP